MSCRKPHTPRISAPPAHSHHQHPPYQPCSPPTGFLRRGIPFMCQRLAHQPLMPIAFRVACLQRLRKILRTDFRGRLLLRRWRRFRDRITRPLGYGLAAVKTRLDMYRRRRCGSGLRLECRRLGRAGRRFGVECWRRSRAWLNDLYVRDAAISGRRLRRQAGSGGEQCRIVVQPDRNEHSYNRDRG